MKVFNIIRNSSKYLSQRYVLIIKWYLYRGEPGRHKLLCRHKSYLWHSCLTYVTSM
jgi:hypothetical protein